MVNVCVGKHVKKCECRVLCPLPLPLTGTVCPLHMTRHSTAVTESVDFRSEELVQSESENVMEASSDEIDERDMGLPPEIPITHMVNQFAIQFIVSDDDASVIVGFYVLIDGKAVVRKRFYEPFKLRRFRAIGFGVVI